MGRQHLSSLANVARITALYCAAIMSMIHLAGCFNGRKSAEDSKNRNNLFEPKVARETLRNFINRNKQEIEKNFCGHSVETSDLYHKIEKYNENTWFIGRWTIFEYDLKGLSGADDKLGYWEIGTWTRSCEEKYWVASLDEPFCVLRARLVRNGDKLMVTHWNVIRE